MTVGERLDEMFNKGRYYEYWIFLTDEEKDMLYELREKFAHKYPDKIFGDAIKLYYRAATAAEDCRDMLDIADIYKEVNNI